MAREFRVGERVLLVDNRRRRYLRTLQVGGEFHTHAGIVFHDDVIGQSEGVELRSTRNARYVAVRPTLDEYVVEMPRGAQIIYPKDLGQILIQADIRPGDRVLESGLGSGSLSCALLRAGAEITGYELREDFAARAVENVTGFLGPEALTRYHVEIRDAYDSVDAPQGMGDEQFYDRIVLDLPEPWQVVRHATKRLRRGGIFLAYLPTIIQTHQLRSALLDAEFELASTLEVLQRGWNIKGLSVRPDHRMVAHTGFLTSARWLGGRPSSTDQVGTTSEVPQREPSVGAAEGSRELGVLEVDAELFNPEGGD